jgi:outer membrane protein TolC
LLGGITQPLFAGGTLLHQKRGAEAALDQAGAEYRATVLNAFQNVADSLNALKYDADTVRLQLVSERAAARSLDIAQKSLKLGATSYFSVLTAQQAHQEAASALTQARVDRYTDTVALFQALGGGWWNRQDVVATNTGVGATSRQNTSDGGAP